jgi:hypothetical protein
MSFTVYDIENMADRVDRGIFLLDKCCPDWRLRIQLPSLDMESMYACVLGQVFGTYGNGCEELGLDDLDGGAAEYGFDMTRARNEYAPLRTLWEKAIRPSEEATTT